MPNQRQYSSAIKTKPKEVIIHLTAAFMQTAFQCPKGHLSQHAEVFSANFWFVLSNV